MIVHDDKTRLCWRLALVEDFIKGKDGYVQAANVRIGNLRTSRLIVKLYPLEVSSAEIEEPNQQELRDEPVPNKGRPRRRAATRQIAEWTNTLAREDVENSRLVVII